MMTGKSFEPCADGTPLKDYTGTISVTNGGRTCQRWSSNDTHAHSYTTSDFPLDDSVESVVNYCRSIEGNTPFCLTNDPHVRGQNCDKQICGGISNLLYSLYFTAGNLDNRSHWLRIINLMEHFRVTCGSEVV